MTARALARMRARVGGVCLGMAAVMALAGCTETVDEGATDYRKATINNQSAQGAPTDISKKYALSNTTEYAGNGAIPITAGRRYYVSLLQAFVGPEARVGGANWFQEHEQVALVLRVHDSNDRAHPGRLVFFTDDLKLGGQFLNFSNLLTIGPTAYQGGVVTIDVDEVHLRGTTNHIKEMLQELAQEPDCPLGAHPASSGHDECDDEPTPDAGGPSDTAQSALVGPAPGKRRTWEARERDLFNLIDTDGYSTRYTLTLLPSGGVEGLPYPRFEAGNYVLMRHDKRDNAFEWGRLQLDNNTGRLVYAATHSDEGGQLASRDPHNDTDLNYQSRKDRFDSSGKKDLWQEQAGDYREQSYVTLQVNALDDPAPPAVVNPPRTRSLTQEQTIRGQHKAAMKNSGQTAQ
ncbi:MAG: hypothetical protein WCA78_13885 [Rhizomicrobium sp.]